MRCCKSVNLRSRDKRNGLKSIFLEFYPGYRDSETMELRRRRALGMYIYAQPQTAAEKEYNRQIMEKAEIICCQVYLEVLNERYCFFSKDKMKERFLPYFEEQLRKTNTKSLSSYKHFVKFCGGSCSFEELDLPLCRKYTEYLLHARDLNNKKRFISIVSKINLRKITLRRINSDGIDVFALHFNW